ncbi:hypothetical protein FNF29_04995 [Cafeteria roenbergensis]|uniref:Uncharacterized protein n=1 Tax=Cafeteria roenbergensis TaxID=33653 RepID=A0A5A8CGE5_CAFRO|nr:hypothetical protein FNF29_04995 [Cafeteria roenbergensis]|eukprot:KAA0150881.1 hypothetical protein FNF29_04995 [Cafeteria roenbergensis]
MDSSRPRKHAYELEQLVLDAKSFPREHWLWEAALEPLPSVLLAPHLSGSVCSLAAARRATAPGVDLAGQSDAGPQSRRTLGLHLIVKAAVTGAATAGRRSPVNQQKVRFFTCSGNIVIDLAPAEELPEHSRYNRLCLAQVQSKPGTAAAVLSPTQALRLARQVTALSGRLEQRHTSWRHTSSHAWELPDEGLGRQLRASIPPGTRLEVDVLEPANSTLVIEVEGRPFRAHPTAYVDVNAAGSHSSVISSHPAAAVAATLRRAAFLASAQAITGTSAQGDEASVGPAVERSPSSGDRAMPAAEARGLLAAAQRLVEIFPPPPVGQVLPSRAAADECARRVLALPHHESGETLAQSRSRLRGWRVAGSFPACCTDLLAAVSDYEGKPGPAPDIDLALHTAMANLDATHQSQPWDPGHHNQHAHHVGVHDAHGESHPDQTAAGGRESQMFRMIQRRLPPWARWLANETDGAGASAQRPLRNHEAPRGDGTVVILRRDSEVHPLWLGTSAFLTRALQRQAEPARKRNRAEAQFALELQHQHRHQHQHTPLPSNFAPSQAAREALGELEHQAALHPTSVALARAVLGWRVGSAGMAPQVRGAIVLLARGPREILTDPAMEQVIAAMYDHEGPMASVDRALLAELLRSTALVYTASDVAVGSDAMRSLTPSAPVGSLLGGALGLEDCRGCIAATCRLAAASVGMLMRMQAETGVCHGDVHSGNRFLAVSPEGGEHGPDGVAPNDFQSHMYATPALQQPRLTRNSAPEGRVADTFGADPVGGGGGLWPKLSDADFARMIAAQHSAAPPGARFPGMQAPVEGAAPHDRHGPDSIARWRLGFAGKLPDSALGRSDRVQLGLDAALVAAVGDAPDADASAVAARALDREADSAPGSVHAVRRYPNVTVHPIVVDMDASSLCSQTHSPWTRGFEVRQAIQDVRSHLNTAARDFCHLKDTATAWHNQLTSQPEYSACARGMDGTSECGEAIRRQADAEGKPDPAPLQVPELPVGVWPIELRELLSACAEQGLGPTGSDRAVDDPALRWIGSVNNAARYAAASAVETERVSHSRRRSLSMGDRDDSGDGRIEPSQPQINASRSKLLRSRPGATDVFDRVSQRQAGGLWRSNQWRLCSEQFNDTDVQGSGPCLSLPPPLGLPHSDATELDPAGGFALAGSYLDKAVPRELSLELGSDAATSQNLVSMELLAVVRSLLLESVRETLGA